MGLTLASRGARVELPRVSLGLRGVRCGLGKGSRGAQNHGADRPGLHSINVQTRQAMPALKTHGVDRPCLRSTRTESTGAACAQKRSESTGLACAQHARSRQTLPALSKSTESTGPARAKVTQSAGPACVQNHRVDRPFLRPKRQQSTYSSKNAWSWQEDTLALGADRP